MMIFLIGLYFHINVAFHSAKNTILYEVYETFTTRNNDSVEKLRRSVASCDVI